MNTVPGQSILTNVRRSARANLRTSVFLLKVLPNLPSRPIDWLTREPTVTSVRYPTSEGEVEGDFYTPGTPGPHPGVVVCLGVVPFGVDHPQVPRLGRALARSGFATLLFWSPTMRDLRMDPIDIDDIALAYQWLIDQPAVDPVRSGLLGTCVGGSVALLAAADPAISQRVSFVVAWAPFGSMRSLARDVSSATTTVNDQIVPWEVDQLTRRVFVRTVTAQLPPAERELLRESCAERAAERPMPDLSGDGRAVYPLLTALSRSDAETMLDNLPPELARRIDQMSPLGCLSDIHADTIIIAHDIADTVVPINESRRLVDRLGGRPGLHYTEFTMFQHLDPTRVHLPIAALARELVRFFRCVYPIFRISAGQGSAK